MITSDLCSKETKHRMSSFCGVRRLDQFKPNPKPSSTIVTDVESWASLWPTKSFLMKISSLMWFDHIDSWLMIQCNHNRKSVLHKPYDLPRAGIMVEKFTHSPRSCVYPEYETWPSCKLSSWCSASMCALSLGLTSQSLPCLLALFGGRSCSHGVLWEELVSCFRHPQPITNSCMNCG